jgi:acetolactate synthase-1/3 small subunit
VPCHAERLVKAAPIQDRELKITMLKTFVVHVENKPGVLTRVASLFRRRAFNIDSLTVGRTEKPEVSRMTITVDADQDQARRIEASLYKLVNVLLVEDVTDEPALMRDLAMIKVAVQHPERSHLLQLLNVFRARVLDVAPESLIIEITGAETKIDRLLEVLRPYEVLEMVRTGIVAMRRGRKSSTVAPPAEELHEVIAEANDDEGQSV